MSFDCNEFDESLFYYPLSAASEERLFSMAFGGDPAPSAASIAPPANLYLSCPPEYTFHRSDATQWRLDDQALTLNDIFHPSELVSGDTFTLPSIIVGDGGGTSGWCGKSQTPGWLVSTASTGERIGAPCIIFPHVQVRLTQVFSDISQGEHTVDFVGANPNANANANDINSSANGIRNMYPLRFSRNEIVILRTNDPLRGQYLASEPQTFENIGVKLYKEGATDDSSKIPGTVTLCISAVCRPANIGSMWDFCSLNDAILNEPILNEPILIEPILNEPILIEPILNEPILNVNEPMGRPNVGIFPI